MSTACWRLKSPQSLSCTFTHPTMVTQSNSHHIMSWMINLHLFGSISISTPVHETSVFQTLTLKIQGHGHGYGQRPRSHNQPITQLICFLFVSHQSDQQFLRYSYFKSLPWKNPRSRSWVRSKVKITSLTQYPTDALPFHFTSIDSFYRCRRLWRLVTNQQGSYDNRARCYMFLNIKRNIF